MKKIYKVKRHDSNGSHNGACHLYSDILIFENNDKAMPPHDSSCTCYLIAASEKEIDDFLYQGEANVLQKHMRPI